MELWYLLEADSLSMGPLTIVSLLHSDCITFLHISQYIDKGPGDERLHADSTCLFGCYIDYNPYEIVTIENICLTHQYHRSETVNFL